jgi:hypothetical protein
MSETTHHSAPVRRSYAPVIAGLLLAIGAIVLMTFSFVNGITAALDGSDGNSQIFIVLFIVGGVLAVIAAVIGIVGLVRGSHRILSAIVVVIALIPAIAIVALRIANGA